MHIIFYLIKSIYIIHKISSKQGLCSCPVPTLSGTELASFNDDRHWSQMWMLAQLLYNHVHDSSTKWIQWYSLHQKIITETSYFVLKRVITPPESIPIFIQYQGTLFFKMQKVSELLLLNTNSAIFQLYDGENKFIFNEMMMRFSLY
jgi:hypothetical protein